MELEVKLLRARVWLSQRAVGSQEGFLAVTRIANRPEKLTYGALDAAAQPTACSQRKYESVALKWSEPPRVAVVAGDAAPPPSSSAVVPMTRNGRPPPRIEFLLFMIRSASKRPQQHQRIAFIGKAALRLSVGDVAAMHSQQEIVFTTVLDAALGSLEVKVKVGSGLISAAQGGDAAESGGTSAFSVNWSSSEALQRDLAEKGADLLLMRVLYQHWS